MSFLDKVNFNGANIGPTNNPFMAKPGNINSPFKSKPANVSPFNPAPKPINQAKEENDIKIENNTESVNDELMQEENKLEQNNNQNEINNEDKQLNGEEEQLNNTEEQANKSNEELTQQSDEKESEENISNKEDIEEKENMEQNEEQVKKPKRQRKTKKKTSSSSDENSESDDTEKVQKDVIESIFKIPTTDLSYAEAMQLINNNFIDEEWEEFRQNLIEESDDIVIESDMQEGAVKKTLSKLSILREKVWIPYMDTKVKLESLSNKDTEGLIERVKYSRAEGANDCLRKKSGIVAVMEYKTPNGENLNLYELYYETRKRFLFLKGILDSIAYKSNILITMSSAIKLEKNNNIKGE